MKPLNNGANSKAQSCPSVVASKRVGLVGTKGVRPESHPERLLLQQTLMHLLLLYFFNKCRFSRNRECH